MSIENSREVDTITPESVDSAASGSGRPANTLFQKIFSFPVLMGALLVGAAVFASRLNLPDPDLWWHVAIGKHILATHAVPTSDAHSFTVPGAPWMAYEWLGEVVMAASALLGGLQGMTALLFLLAATFMALFYGYATLVSGNSKAALIPCALALPLLKVFFTVRPQLFGYIFLIVTLIFLERFRQGKQKSLWLLPPLFLIWVNTHGSFVFGLTVLGIYWASGLIEFEAGGLRAERWTDGQRRHLEIIFLLCVLALMVSPYGTRQAAYPLQMAFFEPVNVSHINEWQALPFEFWQVKLLLVLVLVFWLAQIPVREHYRLESMALLLLATYASFVHRRFIPFLLLIMIPLLAKLIARWAPAYDPSIDKFAINAVLMVLIATGLIIALPSRKKLEDTVVKIYPQKAIEYFDQHPQPGPTLNEYGWGGYLIYSPDYHRKVFVDGRADFYEYAGVLADYLDMTDVKPDTLFLLRKYKIQSCLLHQDAPLGTMLAAMPGWKMVYKDKLAAIYVRRPVEAQPVPPAPAETTRQNINMPR
ncbi:MAG TPA: hypothetical protein VNG91_05665 [Terriglobia bacterium]|nr:hypothetical protein [Terriglobia bacterium]